MDRQVVTGNDREGERGGERVSKKDEDSGVGGASKGRKKTFLLVTYRESQRVSNFMKKAIFNGDYDYDVDKSRKPG
jgi:hypothetical protein